jgi:hypothetical protein
LAWAWIFSSIAPPVGRQIADHPFTRRRDEGAGIRAVSEVVETGRNVVEHDHPGGVIRPQVADHDRQDHRLAIGQFDSVSRHLDGQIGLAWGLRPAVELMDRGFEGTRAIAVANAAAYLQIVGAQQIGQAIVGPD